MRAGLLHNAATRHPLMELLLALLLDCAHGLEYLHEKNIIHGGEHDNQWGSLDGWVGGWVDGWVAPGPRVSCSVHNGQVPSVRCSPSMLKVVHSWGAMMLPAWIL
jgi:hypothetical protein